MVRALFDGTGCSVEGMEQLVSERGAPKLKAGERALDQWRSECAVLLAQLRADPVYEEIDRQLGGSRVLVEETTTAAAAAAAAAGAAKRGNNKKGGDGAAGEATGSEAAVTARDRLALVVLSLFPLKDVLHLGDETSPLFREVALLRNQLHAIHACVERRGGEGGGGGVAAVGSSAAGGGCMDAASHEPCSSVVCSAK